MSVTVNKTHCLLCRKTTRALACGHAYHLKCLHDKKNCTTCGALARYSMKQQCESVPDAMQRVTTGVNGNAFISVTQHDDYGRTTITREIFKDKIAEYAQLAQDTPAAQCQGNLGLMFMKTLMGGRPAALPPIGGGAAMAIARK